MQKEYNVLSLFDGMSCGQIALNRLGIKYTNYFASEIDKHAIKVTQENFPNTIQIGSVIEIKGASLPKIDLLIGGSPCQGFSFAGKQLNFNDERSKLFFEYVRILKELREINPEIKFLLENVKMKKEYQNVISKYLGVSPIAIDSALVSAQHRRRLYWTNIGLIKNDLSGNLESIITQPEDRKVFLKDVLEDEVDEKYFLTQETLEKISNWKSYENPLEYIFNGEDKMSCLTARGASEMHAGMKLIYGAAQRIRRLTPIEQERLQTVPDNYTNYTSERQRGKMLGNGWNVDTICHILKYIEHN